MQGTNGTTTTYVIMEEGEVEVRTVEACVRMAQDLQVRRGDLRGHEIL